MNGAPDWQDGECCFRCRTQFTLVARKHHCRNCGNIFCAKCSSQQVPLPKLNIEKNVRVCDGCFEKLTKEEDSLALALDNNSSKSSGTDTNKPKSTSKSPGGSVKQSSNKPTANASAPSEQELKEEEELQLALALSLSEAPAKVSFPDCRQFEEGPSASTATTGQPSTSVNHTSNNVTPQPYSSIKSTLSNVTQPVVPTTPEQPQYASTTPEKQSQPNTNPVPNQYPQDYVFLEGDQELFRFVADVQSTSEVFTNRVNSSKLRNRPIANDSAIQALFMKLTNMHTKLLEYITQHEEERAGYEVLQDKLSQITDARAALDALREEHQERIRQEAAEAERQRQNQLALKLETMRQKKSQMMQYQREVALERIRAQEMMLRQPQNNFQAVPAPASVPQQVLPQSQSQPVPQPQPLPQVQQQPQIQQYPSQQPQISTQQTSTSGQSYPPQQIHHQISQPIPQSLQTIPKLDDEAPPLISFDD